ncbi:MAG: hypothetical protein DNFNHJIP_00578 [Candidatus Argoarchaeum ethanivorans]|uniref:Uncharacterized protein n=1 Tax=Candidatus Argoarchaeum ethanivorans TaxID=2608793 RepID=A0A812A1B9_9EURY|nr:MAG: hypothetical protein DNFNHJIP_00578 [Candidatus Argoarchaeum ethanivorans]
MKFDFPEKQARVKTLEKLARPARLQTFAT